MVWKMAVEEGVSQKKISEILKGEGFDVSQNAVWSWLLKKRTAHAKDVQEVLQDHLDRVLPTDLNALEIMEAKLLDWAEKTTDFKSHELAKIDKFIDFFREKWVDRLLDASSTEKDLRALGKEILQQCFKWILEEINWTKERRMSMNSAMSVVDLKLKYATLLHGSGSGNIVINAPGGSHSNGPGPQENDQPKEVKIGSEKGNVVSIKRDSG